MRLIDADELRKEFKDSPIDLAMKILVDTQPTAYDIDKVVKEIEDYSFRTFGEIRTENVIEIVKQGAR